MSSQGCGLRQRRDAYNLHVGDLIEPGDLYIRRILFKPAHVPKLGIVIEVVRLWETYDEVIGPFAYNVLWQNGDYELVWPDELVVVYCSDDSNEDDVSRHPKDEGEV